MEDERMEMQIQSERMNVLLSMLGEKAGESEVTVMLREFNMRLVAAIYLIPTKVGG